MNKIFALLNQRRSEAAFSLPELLVVIVIIGVIGAIGIQAFFFLVQRARVQSVALEVAGWIENVRNASADEVNPNPAQGGCLITFTPTASLAGQSLATVDDACGVPEDELFIPQALQQDAVTITIAGPASIVFTPRGLWTNQAGTTGIPFAMNINLNNAGPLRCVRLSPTLGSVEVGRPANSPGVCTEWQTL